MLIRIIALFGYKISDIIIQTGSIAERDGRISRILGHYGGYVRFLPKIQFKQKFGDFRTQGIVVIALEHYILEWQVDLK